VIKFACSKCGKHISVDDKYAGKRGKCPDCGETVVVPGKSKAIAFCCAGCGHTIKVPESYAGKKGKCPRCKNAVAVPPLKKEPVAESPATTIACPMCGQAIGVAEGTVDESVECPECGSYIDPSSGEIASQADDAMPAGGEEDLDDEPVRAPQGSAGVDRRLLLIISGVAAIVIVGLIGLIVVLRSSGSPAAERPDARRANRRYESTVATGGSPCESAASAGDSRSATPRAAGHILSRTGRPPAVCSRPGNKANHACDHPIQYVRSGSGTAAGSNGRRVRHP